MFVFRPRFVSEYNINHNWSIPVIFNGRKSVRTMGDHRNRACRIDRIRRQVQNRVIHANDNFLAGSGCLAGGRRGARGTDLHRNFVHLRDTNGGTLELQNNKRIDAPYQNPYHNLVDSRKRGPPGRWIWSAHEISLNGRGREDAPRTKTFPSVARFVEKCGESECMVRESRFIICCQPERWGGMLADCRTADHGDDNYTFQNR